MSYKAKLLMSLKNKYHHTHISPLYAENTHKKIIKLRKTTIVGHHTQARRKPVYCSSGHRILRHKPNYVVIKETFMVG